MKRPHLSPAWIIVTLLSLIAGLNAVVIQDAQAQFTSPPGQGKPRETAGGGSRPGQSLCLQRANRQETLVAMAPNTFVGLTHAASPTIWVYIPNTTAKALEFSVFTDKQEGIYQTDIPINATGLLKISLPPDALTLQPNQPYRWTVALICNPIQRSNDWLVDGWIQHQSLPTELQRQLAQATADQQIMLYLQAGFWYEAFNAYLALQQQQPNQTNLAQLWTDLLNSAGLQAIALPAKMTQVIR